MRGDGLAINVAADYEGIRMSEFNLQSWPSDIDKLLAMAEAHVEDIESGITEGLYAASHNSDLATKKAAIANFRALSMRSDFRTMAGYATTPIAWDVGLKRVPVQSCDVRVVALTQGEAETMALAIAGDQEYTTATVEFEIDTVRVVGNDQPNERTETNQFENRYVCPNCKTEWHDVWSSMCDDDCPKCGTRHISPIESVDL